MSLKLKWLTVRQKKHQSLIFKHANLHIQEKSLADKIPKHAFFRRQHIIIARSVRIGGGEMFEN